MPKLLMITGIGSAKDLASEKKGAFYNTLEEFHRYWERIDIISPRFDLLKDLSRNSPEAMVRDPRSNLSVTINYKLKTKNYFGNVYLHISPWPMIFYPFWFLKKALEIYKEQKFDLMTVHEFPPFYNGIAARILWRKAKIPYVLEIHHIPGYPKAASLKELAYRWSMRLFIKFDSSKAKAVRVVNRTETRKFLVKAGVPEEKIKYIPSMYIDLDIFKPITNYLPDRQAGQLPVTRYYDLVFAARLEKNKGIFNLIEAVKIIKEKKPNIKLLIIGSGSEKKSLTFKVSSLKLQENIFFSGWLATSYDVAKAYNSARIFINPSFNEGGPRVALEAMACGLPVITTRVGIMNDLIKDGESGIFVDWRPEDMAGKIIGLLEDKNLLEKLSNSSTRVAQNFEKKSAIRNYAEELQNLVEK